MTTSPFDGYRPPEPPRRRRRRGARDAAGGPASGRRGGGSDGAREQPMVEEAQFSSYYGRPIVKAPPWHTEIGAYLVLGGIAGGSALLALGGQLTERPTLRRNSRFAAIGAAGVGALALIADLGRPERFLNMFRTFKVTSPMSLGSWILGGFSAAAGLAAAADAERLVRPHLAVPGVIQRLLGAAERPAGVAAGVFAAPLAAYTAVLLSATANPVWNAARKHLAFVFVSSASLAASGVAMITTPTAETKPARVLAGLGVVGDVVAMRIMKRGMHPAEREPLETGAPGHKLHLAEWLAIGGGIGTLVAGRSRIVAVLSGAALVAASTLTRFGVLEAGTESVKDPRHVVEPQKARLAARRAAGITDDSITTVE